MILAIGGQTVDDIDSEYALTLKLSGGAQLRFENPFEVAGLGDDRTLVDPEDLAEHQALLDSLRGRVVERAVADDVTGSLSVTFGKGLVIDVAANENFEAWSAGWPDGAMVVATPGGALTEFPPRL